MGEVYRARDRLTGGSVAVKLLHASSRDAERFKREAQLLAEVSHPRIVKYVSHGIAEGSRPYIAMEWLEGEDLGERLSRSGLTLLETLTVRAPRFRGPRCPPRARDRPSRHQTLEHLPAQQEVRRAQAARPRRSAPPPCHAPFDAQRRDGRNAGLHGARASEGQQGDRRPGRRLLARLSDVRVPGRAVRSLPATTSLRCSRRSSSRRR